MVKLDSFGVSTPEAIQFHRFPPSNWEGGRRGWVFANYQKCTQATEMVAEIEASARPFISRAAKANKYPTTIDPSGFILDPHVCNPTSEINKMA